MPNKGKIIRNQNDFDDLFTMKNGDDRKFAALSFPGNGHMHIVGYIKSIEIIRDYVLKKGGNNAIVYPLAFVCRHAIELALKESIEKACEVYTQNTPKFLWSTHDLQKLVGALEMVYTDVKTFSDWAKARQFILKLNRADPNGEFTRFSRDTAGQSIQVKDTIYVGRIVESSLNCLDSLQGFLIQLEEEQMSKQEAERSALY